MGKSLLHRQGERKRKMYLLLILLISPALGRPSSAQSGVGNKLEAVSEFTKEMSRGMKNSKLFGNVNEHLQEAKQNIREIEEELTELQSEVTGLQNTDNYFPEFEEALNYIRLARKDLSKLAQTTQITATNLTWNLNFIDYTSDPNIQIPLISTFIATTKSLMLETKKKLEDARGKYNSAHQAFDNLIVSVATQNGILDRTVKHMNAQYQEDKYRAERESCENETLLQVLTLGICHLVSHFFFEVPLEEDRVKLVNLKSKFENILEKTRILNRDIDNAIDVIKVEVELIIEWTASAKVVEQNLVSYPEESLRKFKSIRTAFKNELNALGIAAQNFVDQFLSV